MKIQSNYSTITKQLQQKIYKELSEAATRYYDAKFFKKTIPNKTIREYVIARERAACILGKAYAEKVRDLSYKDEEKRVAILSFPHMTCEISKLTWQ